MNVFVPEIVKALVNRSNTILPCVSKEPKRKRIEHDIKVCVCYRLGLIYFWRSFLFFHVSVDNTHCVVFFFGSFLFRIFTPCKKENMVVADIFQALEQSGMSNTLSVTVYRYIVS